MKVLFAVSSESISDAIIKKYQKDYKEILSYKNVYYFNAILKEIQRDKTYDRIVISEDLEPFSNNNYETIDKFIFEKLDGISDEAQDSQGKDTTIILICTDRHTKGSGFLNKIFSIGVYNALLGNDRSMDQVCQLINKPRSKKEAKLYYKIDQRPEDEGYNPETNEVSELEIQNILNHFKKLGKNTDRFADSFNNIASQYTDEQLKIIINCLPMTVKVILEEECPKYQEIMSVSGNINRTRVTEKIKDDKDKTGIKIDIIENKLNQPKMTGPIVIPSSVRTAGPKKEIPQVPVAQSQKPVAKEPVRQRPVQQPVQPVQKPVQSAQSAQPQRPVGQPVQSASGGQVQRQVQRPAGPTAVAQPQRSVQQPAGSVQKPGQPVQSIQSQHPVQSVVNKPVQKPVQPPVKLPVVEEEVVQEAEEFDDNIMPGVFDDIIEEDTDLNSLLLGLDDETDDEVEDVEEQNEEIEEVDDLDNLLLEMGVQEDEEEETESEEDMNNLFEEDSDDEVLSGMFNEAEETDSVENVEDIVEEYEEETILPEFEDKPEDVVLEVGYKDNDLLGQIDEVSGESVEGNIEEVVPEEPVKKGRGRPRKYFNVQPKPKGKRGRPRKINPEAEEQPAETLLSGSIEDDDVNEINNFLEETTEGDAVLPGMFDEEEETTTEIDNLLEATNEEEAILPGMFDEEVEDESVEETEEYVEEDGEEYSEEASLPGLDELDDLEGFLPTDDYQEDNTGVTETVEEYEEETLLPGMGFEDEEVVEDATSDYNQFDNSDNIEDNMLPQDNEYTSETVEYSTEIDNYDTANNEFEEEEEIPEPFIDSSYNDISDQNYDIAQNNTAVESIKPNVDYSMSSLNSLITKDKKIVTFLGTTKNGTSFLINNLAALFSSLGINTAVLDMTKNRNSYYIYTQNEEELRKTAYNSIEKLQNGFAEGIKVDKNLTVYTSLPHDGKDYSDAEPILSTLVQSHSLILIDCDFDTNPSYFASCQEIYLVQSMDILTIQPLTAFLRELKTIGVLEPEKVRVVINKEVKVRSLTSKVIIGGMSFYNDPAMSFMTELFNKDMVKACSIPFEENAYSKYLESIVNCTISLNGYSKTFLSKLRVLGDMVYPLTSKQTYAKQPEQDYGKSNFSNNMNNTLNQMKKNIRK